MEAQRSQHLRRKTSENRRTEESKVSLGLCDPIPQEPRKVFLVHTYSHLESESEVTTQLPQPCGTLLHWSNSVSPHLKY